jgi:malonate decarboxylase delta subunit
MNDIPAGLETLDFFYSAGRPAGSFAPILVGVVGSGNLEVLLEPLAGSRCVVHIATSARGFGPIWQAVLDDFHARHPLSGIRISINDMGATPAVVGLRLDQAVAEITKGST